MSKRGRKRVDYDHCRHVVDVSISFNFLMLVIEHSENKINSPLNYLKTRLDLECSSPAFNKQVCWKNNKGTKCRPVTTFRLCSCYMEFLQGACFLNASLEHSRSNLVFEIHQHFIFGIFYSFPDYLVFRSKAVHFALCSSEHSGGK